MNRKALLGLYMRICRAYARQLGDRPADAIFSFLCSLEFWREHQYWPHLKNPRTFSEKIFHRMLFDRDPRWTCISDKLRVRDYVSSTLGSNYLIPLLWNGDRPEEIPFDELPSRFVIKTNHGCACNIIVKDKMLLDQTQARRQLEHWLGENFYYGRLFGMAWAYKNIRPTIMVESFLEENGHVPVDYKFFCFSGRVEFFKMDFARYEEHSEKYFDRNLNPLDVFERDIKQYQGKVEVPNNYEEMVRVAESLARDFDFIRVDLYNVDNRIFFGELTCYPAAGLTRFVPKKYDFVFGDKWRPVHGA